MDFTNVALLGAIVGVVELVKRLFDKDYRTATVIAAAGIAGALLAPYAGEPSWFVGLLYGFSASGFVSVASRVGGSK